jgi:hypothetical protein
MPEFTRPELMELIKAVVLIAGTVVACTLFWIGNALRSPEWENSHKYIQYRPAVNLQTRQWVIVPYLSDEAIEEIVSPDPPPMYRVAE